MPNSFESFIIENAEAEVSRLLLSRKSWPSPDDPSLGFFEARELAVNTIEARRKLRDKAPEWWSKISLVYPNALCAEQCSSTVTAAYKVSLAERILSESGVKGGRIADLTGGLGVDTLAFASVAKEVLYNERDHGLFLAAGHNFRELGAGNIILLNRDVTPSSIDGILSGFNPDIIYLDPARRAGGERVYSLEDSSPDVVALVPGLFARSRHILLKISPMEDITASAESLNRSYEAFLESSSGTGWNHDWVREVHAVAAGGECKELLIWMDREWDGERSVVCREDGGTMVFGKTELAAAKGAYPDSANLRFILEPGKSILKAQACNALCQRFGLVKLARFTNLLSFKENLSEEEVRARLGNLVGMGKLFVIDEVSKMGKAALKDIGKRFPKSEVTARNIPLTSLELRNKLGIKSGDDAHIFGVKIDTPFESANFLLVGHRI